MKRLISVFLLLVLASLTFAGEQNIVIVDAPGIPVKVKKTDCIRIPVDVPTGRVEFSYKVKGAASLISISNIKRSKRGMTSDNIETKEYLFRIEKKGKVAVQIRIVFPSEMKLEASEYLIEAID